MKFASSLGLILILNCLYDVKRIANDHADQQEQRASRERWRCVVRNAWFVSVNLAHMAGNTNYEPNGMNCDIHVGYVPIASSRVPRHVACSGRVGEASSVMDDLCPVNFAQMACSTN